MGTCQQCSLRILKNIHTSIEKTTDMKYSSLTKQMKLLVYLVECGYNGWGDLFVVRENGAKLVRAGFVKNNASLNNILYQLSIKGLVKRNGYHGWYVTRNGECLAHSIRKQCTSGKLGDSTSSTLVDSLQISNALEDVSVKLALCKVALDKLLSFGIASKVVQSAITTVQAANDIVKSLPHAYENC